MSSPDPGSMRYQIAAAFLLRAPLTFAQRMEALRYLRGEESNATLALELLVLKSLAVAVDKRFQSGQELESAPVGVGFIGASA